MFVSPHIQLFNSRRKSLPSVLSLIGTGFNFTAQVPALCALKANAFEDIIRVNITSSSVFAYFIIQAHLTRSLRHERLIGLDLLCRELHETGLSTYLSRWFSVHTGKTSFFENQKLGDTCQLLFPEPFLQRTLSSLPDNLCFWAYCTKKNALTKISVSEGYGDMTFAQVIRACATIPKLHGSYPYKNRAFIDPLHSPKAKAFLQQISAIEGNHLILNTKKTEDTNAGTLYVSVQDGPDHSRRDYYRFMLNANNPQTEDTQQQAVTALQQWPLVRRNKPPVRKAATPA